MRNELANSPAMDDKSRPVGGDRGPAPGEHRRSSNVRAVRRLDRAGGNRPARAQTSAFGIDPQVGIAVDVTHATDCPTIDKKARGRHRAGQAAR